MSVYAVYSGNNRGSGGGGGGGGGSVNAVTASAPLASSGGTNPNITISLADATTNGYLSSVDWNTFNSKQAALTPGSISSSTTGITIVNGANSTVGPNVTINIQTASGSQPGLLSAADWTTFNNKQNALSFGNLTDAGTDGITITGGTGAVIGSGTSISQHVADATHNGYLSSTDWSTFNSKQAAGNYITALTGDGTASGPGSAALTLATVNVSPGTYGSASQSLLVAVNAKGLATSVSAQSIQIAESQVTNLVSDLAGKQPVGNYITDLTGDVTASGPGSVAATIANNAVSNAKLATMANNTVKGNKSGSTGNPSDLALSDVVEATSAVLTITNGSKAIIGASNLSIQVSQSGASSDGYLSSTDWNTFNNKADAGSSWDLVGNAGTTPGTDYIGTSDAQDLHIKTNNVDQIVFSANGGFIADQTIIPVDGVGTTQYNLITEIAPNVGTTGAQAISLHSQVNYDGANLGYNFDGQISVNASRFEHGGDGTVTTVIVGDNTALLAANAGNIDTFKGNNLDVQVGAGFHINHYSGVNSYFAANGSSFDGAVMYDSNANIADSTANNINIFAGFLDLHGTSSVAQATTGLQSGLLFADSAYSRNIFGSSVNVQMNDTSSALDVFGHTSNVQLNDSAAVASGVSASNLGVDVRGAATITNGINVLNGNAQIHGTAQTGYVNGINISVNTNDTAIISGATAVNSGINFAGSSTNNGATGGNFNVQMQNSATATNIQGINSNVSLQNTSSASSITAIQGNVNIQDTATVSGNVTVGGFYANSTTPVSNLTGLNVDLANVSSPNVKRGLNINQGAIQQGYTLDTSEVTIGAGVYGINNIGGQLQVASGSPISSGAFGFGNNIGVSLFADDNIDPDGTGLGLGFSSVGFVGQVAVAAGKTVDSYNLMAAGASVPAGSGSITNVSIYRALGILPQGGTATITNLYGFKAESILSAASPTNVWGVWVGDTNADNWFAKNVVIGGMTGKPTGAYALDITGVVKIVDGSQGAGKVLTSDASGVASWQSPGAGSNQYLVGLFTLSGTDITNGYVTLASAPTDPTKTALTVVGGPMQSYGADFTVTGSQLGWTGLFLDGVLAAGDQLIVQFN